MNLQTKGPQTFHNLGNSTFLFWPNTQGENQVFKAFLKTNEVKAIQILGTAHLKSRFYKVHPLV